MQCHIGIGGLVATEGGIVQVARNGEVVALAQRIHVDGLVEVHVDVVTVDEVDRADGRCRAEHLRTLDVLGNLDDSCLEGQFLSAIHAVGLCLQLEDAVLGE